jgi:RND family efflux transporter MFP subunit
MKYPQNLPHLAHAGYKGGRGGLIRRSLGTILHETAVSPILKLSLETISNFRSSLIWAGIFALTGCSNDPPGRDQFVVAAPPVEVVAARFGGLPLVERLSGTVWAENQIALYPEISGHITRVHVANGDTVELGEVLVELDQKQYHSQLRQAEAGFRINEARVRQAEARLAELEAQARRTRSLGDRELVSKLELETLAAQVESARADVALAQAQLEQAAATRAEQEEMLMKTSVRAPISGVVGQRRAEIGMQANPSTRLFTIGNLDRVKVQVNISDNMLRQIKTGQPVKILTATGDGDERVLPGELTRISPFLDDVTRSADAEIEIENLDHWLRPGMFVAVDVLYGRSRQATLIPTSAMFTDPNTGTEGVYVVDRPGDDDTSSVLAAPDPQQERIESTATSAAALSEPRPVEFRPVRIVAHGAMEVAVDTIQPGDWVVTIGQDLLSEGKIQARVRPVSWEHVMTLQGMKREDLLKEILRATTRSDLSDVTRP